MKQVNDTTGTESIFGPVISCYTRADALADGVLVDVSTMAREAGFSKPVALTHRVWQDCVAWTEDDNENQTYQDESGRLWDVLFMAYMGIKQASGSGSQLLFRLHCVPRDGCAKQAKEVTLKLIIGPGDQGEAVITVLLPDEN